MKPHSGLQLQVLALYKKALQAAKRKDIDTMRYVRQRFHEDASSVDRKDFVVIEKEMMTTSAAVAVSPIILETLEAELEPEPEFGSMPPPEVLVDAGDEEDALLDACCRLIEELWSVADALVDADADEET
ncbi:hypothetical protein PRIC1_011740 [Phytophthora ramorum]